MCQDLYTTVADASGDKNGTYALVVSVTAAAATGVQGKAYLELAGTLMSE
jgi:hypothetical protein